MREWQSQTHVRWYCRYHIVIVPKYRKKAIYGVLRKKIGGVRKDLCGQFGVDLVEGHAMPDHVHLCLSIPPKLMDGNGRMGRFLMNVMLAAGGYPWTVIPVEERDAYMEALEAASTTEDIVLDVPVSGFDIVRIQPLSWIYTVYQVVIVKDRQYTITFYQ